VSAKKLLLTLTLITLLLSLATGCQSPAGGPGGRKLVYGLTLTPSGIDPHVNVSSELGIPLTSVYDTLVWQDLDGKFVPGLAESWEVSEDGLTYTFHLRQDVKFHDGAPFNSQAVKSNLDRIVDPQTKSQKAVFMLGPYDHAEVVDDYTVKVYLKEPFAPLLDSLSQVYLGMASPAAIEKWGLDYQMHQVGTGPFMFKEYVPKDHLTLTRNPDYNWPPAVFGHQGAAYLQEVEFRFFVEPATRVLALEAGEAHIMGEMPPQDAQRLSDDPGFQLIPAALPGTPLQIFLNTERPPTDDLSVRQALVYATDREAIVMAIFKNLSPVAHSPLNAVTIGAAAKTMPYDEEVAGLYNYNPELAKDLLKEAGWVDVDGDGVLEKDSQPLRVEAYLMGWGFMPEVAQLVQAQFKAVGVEMQSQVVAYPAALEAAREGKHNLIPFALSSSDPDILRTFFHSEGGFNWAKVRAPRLDALLEEGARTLDPEKRKEIYAEAQQIIMAEALIIPIRDYVNINAASAQVKGLRYDSRGWFPWLYDVYLAESK